MIMICKSMIINEHNRSFHLFVSFPISVVNYSFQCTSLLLLWLEFILRCFILFDVAVHGTGFFLLFLLVPFT